MSQADDWMIKPDDKFCHKSGMDPKRDAPICDWEKCPRKVGMDCYLPDRPKP